MIKNDLSEIFFALKNHHDKKLVLYKKLQVSVYFKKLSLLQHIHEFA